MATVTATNGQVFPLWAGKCLVKDLDEGLSFETLKNELGDKYQSEVLYGSLAGNKDWRLGMPYIQGSSASTPVESIYGGNTTFELYVQEFYHYAKTVGPFAFQCPRTNQYYLAQFADTRLSYQRVLTRLYASSLQIEQIRLPGVSVFDPSKVLQLWARYDPNDFTGTSWPDGTGNGNSLPTVSGDVQHVANAKGGQKVVRMNAAADTGSLTSTLDVTAYDIIAVLKIREAAFSNYGGIVTGDVGTKALVGDNGTTKFYRFAENEPYQYWMNGVEYDKLDMQAPMNTYGIVHLRFPNGYAIANLQLGTDRDYTGRHAKVDYGDVMIGDSPIPRNTIAELLEHLATRWQINTPN